MRQQWIKRGSFVISTIWRTSEKSNFKSINLWASPKNRVLTHSHTREGSAAFIKIENTQTLCKSKNNSNSGFMLFLFSAWVLYINFSRPFSHRKPQPHNSRKIDGWASDTVKLSRINEIEGNYKTKPSCCCMGPPTKKKKRNKVRLVAIVW